MMSAIVDGKVLDFHFRRCKVNNWVVFFYIGDIYVGQISKSRRRHYTVVGKTPNKLSPISGLATRWQAAELLLKMEGYRDDE